MCTSNARACFSGRDRPSSVSIIARGTTPPACLTNSANREYSFRVKVSRLAAQFHQLLAQINTQVFITIGRLAQ